MSINVQKIEMETQSPRFELNHHCYREEGYKVTGGSVTWVIGMHRGLGVINVKNSLIAFLVSCFLA